MKTHTQAQPFSKASCAIARSKIYFKNMDLSAKIEALLFFKSEPVTVSWLSKALEVSEGEVWEALRVLEGALQGRGIQLIRKDDALIFGTNTLASELIEKIAKEELEKDLGRAALETLTIILYKGPISKTEIDYVRGVNSSFILRNLLIRGLVERMVNPHDGRSFLYRPSLDLFSFLGLSKREDLPQFVEVMAELKKFEEEFGEKREA